MIKKKFASTIKKKRFTVRYPDGRVESFGTCNENEDERMDVIKVMQKRDGANGVEQYAQYVLARYHLDDIDYTHQDIAGNKREYYRKPTLIM